MSELERLTESEKLDYPNIKADLRLCYEQLFEICKGEHKKAIMSVPPQTTDFDMQFSATFNELQAYRDTGLTPEEISKLKKTCYDNRSVNYNESIYG